MKTQTVAPNMQIKPGPDATHLGQGVLRVKIAWVI